MDSDSGQLSNTLDDQVLLDIYRSANRKMAERLQHPVTLLFSRQVISIATQVIETRVKISDRTYAAYRPLPEQNDW